MPERSPEVSGTGTTSAARPSAQVPLPVAALCGWIALVLPLVIAINGVGGWPDWSTDRAVVRDIGLVPLGWEGGLSTLLSQLAGVLPLGGRLLRAEWMSALGLALSARVLYALIRRALDAAGAFAANPVLALSASLLFALSPAARHEGSRLGGASVALGLVLLGAYGLWQPSARRDARVWLLVAALAGFTFAQDHAAGCTIALLWLSRALIERGTPAARVALSAALTALGGLGLGLMLHAVRRFGLELWLESAAPVMIVPEPWLARPWPSWAELGPLVAVPAAAGACLALLTSRARVALAPCLLLVALELAQRGLGALVGRAPPASVELCAVAGAAGLFALCVQSAGRFAWSVELPFAKPACALLITFCLTLVLQRLDGLALDEPARPLGADAWSEHALGRLPASSLLLVRSDALLLRAWAARVLHDERPDVVVVPASAFAGGMLGAGAMPRRPELAPLARQLTVSGFVDEYTMSQLADGWPLFAELDPHWDRRLLEHLAPAGLWLRVAPQALAPSERARGAAGSRRALRDALALAEEAPLGRDRGLRRALAHMATEQALSLAALGDHRAARAHLRAQRELDRSEPSARALQQRLAAQSGGLVAVHDLID
jgi:hypothetical protein